LIKASVRSAVRQSLAAGVTTVGDITRSPEQVRPLLRESPLRAVSFGEVIAVGKLRAQLRTALADASDACATSPTLRIGVSPHAPYTVEPDGLRACADQARGAGLPLAIHLAETIDEAMFTTEHRGDLRSYLERLGVWDEHVPCPHARPIDLAAATGLLTDTTVLAHANYLSDAEIGVLAGAGSHVVYCPRTHAAFGHPPHRYRAMLAAGINVCVGTDSLASTPSLSILDELRWLHANRHDCDPATLLEMGTLRGARALAWDDDVGSLGIGKAADFAVVPLDPVGPADPVVNVLSSACEVVATYVAGDRIEYR
jgi:cytosine/adenosine deaminase-related metal-dependent hydrolase